MQDMTRPCGLARSRRGYESLATGPVPSCTTPRPSPETTGLAFVSCRKVVMPLPASEVRGQYW